MLQIAQTGEARNNTKTELQSKCLHVSAFCSAFQSSLQQQPQMLHFYSSVSQKRPPDTRRSGSAPVPLPCHLVFTLRTSRGTPRTIYPVNIQPLAFCPPCIRKAFASVSVSQAADFLPASLYWERRSSSVFIRMTSFVSLLFLSLFYPVPPSFPPFLSSERVEEIPWYIVLRKV